jgi:glycogen(starch) synthase
MRILMLGWEFPPFIAGGLGVACHGLTRALDRQGHEVIFVLPRPIGDAHKTHVRLLSPASVVALAQEAASRGAAAAEPVGRPVLGGKDRQSAGDAGAAGASSEERPLTAPDGSPIEMERSTVHAVGASFVSPYPKTPHAVDRMMDAMRTMGSMTSASDAMAWFGGSMGGSVGAAAIGAAMAALKPMEQGDSQYGGDLIADAERYSRMVVALGYREKFDVIHAHDWLTYPAGIALSYVTGKPLVVHVHATEFDRSGEHVNQRVYEIEREGMHAAAKVVAVSMLTKGICTMRYGVPADKVEVVYNGVDHESVQPIPQQTIEARDKIVLFLGRITMQKGPEYFIAAAKRVLDKMENVKFVVAGSGDMALRMIELAAGMGIGHKVLFTGFLRGADVERVFKMADCYVMPSVSEPFGIAPLEAMSHDTPVIISKQSGVSEVLTHALKVDFWDIDEMANKIVAVLKYPPLSQTLREHGRFEVRRLTWDGAAERCVQIYKSVAHA